MVYLMYIVLVGIFVGLYHYDAIAHKLKPFFKMLLKAIFNIGEYLCVNLVARHFLIMTGKTMFNLGNAALFFAMSGFLVSILGYPVSSLESFLFYGIILTISGYVLSHCRKI